MAAPTPTPSQIEGIEGAKALAESAVSGADLAIQGYEEAIVVYTDIDNFAKSLFDYYSAIIRNYELEVRYMNGLLVAAPIVEADILDLVESTGRLFDGTLEAARIDEFDGLPLDPTDDKNETDQFPLQDDALTKLQSGFGTTSMTNGVTNSIITSASTSGSVDSDNSGELSDGNFLLVNSGSDAAIFQVSGVAEVGIGPFTYTFTIDNFEINPVGTLGIGSTAGGSFSGFNNTERTSHVAAPAWRQSLFDVLLDLLNDSLDDRRAALVNELSAFTANDNEAKDPQAGIDISTSISAIDGFLGVTPPATLDVSDTGITAIDAEKVVRLAEITARITTVATEISTGDVSGSFYDSRYDQAAQRGQIANGHLAQLKALEKAKANAEAGQVSAQALADRYESMIT